MIKIIESFHFIHENPQFLKRQFSISKDHIFQAIEGVHATVEWLKTSVFHLIVNDLTFHISDEPINFPGELAIEEREDFHPVVYINVMSIVDDYQKQEFLYDMKVSNTTCFDYAAFVTLHEVGHYVQALIGGQGKSKKEKIYDYFDRGEHHYDRFVEHMKHGDSFEEKRRYRNIPHEKAADDFARLYLNCLKRESY